MVQFDKYRLAFDISPVPMLLVSSSGEILLTNDLLDQLFEYKPTELAGKNVDVLVPESTREHHPVLRDAYFKLPSKRQMGQGRDLSGITQTGQIIPLELGLDSVIIGDEVCALVVALDIRHRKQHEGRMNLAMDAAASAMIMVDKDGLVVFINKAAVALFGYEESELLNHPVERLVPREIRRAHPVYRGSFMNSSEARAMGKEKDLYALHREGHKIPVEIALTLVETPSGKMVMSTIIDLTERVAAGREAAKKAEELADVNHELSQFAYSASHDLKAPLSSIVGLLNICLEDLEEGNASEVRENLKKCLQISARSASKIEGVLEIARVGRDGVTLESTDLTQAIREIWLDLTGANENRIQLMLDLKHADPVLIEPQTFKVIFENILSNAIRYGDARKSKHSIEVKTTSDESYIYVHVADNGMGIPQAKQHVVFHMFKRIDERSGDGLGMALVKKQVDRLGGNITFKSAEGEGTEFIVSLPLRTEV